MALIKCKECEKEISSDAVNCPSCGAPVKPIKKKGGFLNFLKKMVITWLVIAAVFYAGFLYIKNSFQEKAAAVKVEKAEAAKSKAIEEKKKAEEAKLRAIEEEKKVEQAAKATEEPEKNLKNANKISAIDPAVLIELHKWTKQWDGTSLQLNNCYGYVYAQQKYDIRAREGMKKFSECNARCIEELKILKGAHQALIIWEDKIKMIYGHEENDRFDFRWGGKI